ncbi:MAG: stage III sporulation protein AF [Candidatus Coproplasma sp.]
MKAEYLYAALGVVFLSVVAGLLVPEGKLKKSINFVLRLICICVLINPVINLFGIEEQVENISLDYDYICEVYSKNQSSLLTQKVIADCGVECVCTVSVVYEEEKIKENGVTVTGNFEDEQTINKIVEYLKGLGYIDINVNDEGCELNQ